MIEWTKQHCGLRKATYNQMINLMPDLKEVLETFPENPNDFYWDVKVHMLMPNQYPCIPNWHYDNVPRDKSGNQDWDKVDESKPMYLWLSGLPLTEFRDELGNTRLIEPNVWTRFSQKDEHRGTISKEFTWRCFIRATHRDLTAKQPTKNHNPLRRHSQVYLDASNFSW